MAFLIGLICFVVGCAVFWFGSVAVKWFRARRETSAPAAYYSAPLPAPAPPTKEDYLLMYSRAAKSEAERLAMKRAAEAHVAQTAGDLHGEFVSGLAATPPQPSTTPPPVPNG
jgi:hypothetical protein